MVCEVIVNFFYEYMSSVKLPTSISFYLVQSLKFPASWNKVLSRPPTFQKPIKLPSFPISQKQINKF